MRGLACLLVIVCFAPLPALRANDLPMVFARSGQKARLPVSDAGGQADQRFSLWALGRQWGEELSAKDGAIEIVAPQVRVPVAFQLVSSRQSERAAHAELLVYPDRPISWGDKLKKIQFLAVGVPEWFIHWVNATRFPGDIHQEWPLNLGEWRQPSTDALLIVGKGVVGKHLAGVRQLAADRNTEVLVLDAEWLGDSQGEERLFPLMPGQMTGPLTDLQTQDWATPPRFEDRVLRIINRRTWIAGPEHPLVEEVFDRSEANEESRMVFNYIPWQRQLGRSEVADGLFVRLLTEASKRPGDRPTWTGRWRLVYPTIKEIKAGERPVLAAAMKSNVEVNRNGTDSPVANAYVLDLRGKAAPSSNLLDESAELKMIEARIGAASPLLILGDHPILDTWKWLELDRMHHRSARPGVVWWSDDSLPPCQTSRLRLMELFTKWNIFLEHNAPEAKYEDRTHEP